MSAGCLRLFFLPFLGMGLFFLWLLTIQPAWQSLAAQQWTPTPCVVESSQVKTHSSSDGPTYSIEVVYRYFWEGREYTSKEYQFSGGSSGGRKSKALVVRRFPPGTETTCYVNPNAPSEAVIHRGPNVEMAWGGIGLIFALVGGLGLAFAGRLTQNKGQVWPQPIAATGPGEWKPKHTPLAKFFGLLIGTLIWNGFVGLFVFLVFLSDERKSVPLFAKIIVGLFLIVGVALVFGVFTRFLALFNPRIRLAASTGHVPLGGELPFTWSISGRAGMLRKVRIVLEGREEATYRRGTNNVTDTKVFAEIPVFESIEREIVSQGGGRIVVPADSMHTFEAGSNNVLWRLRVRGEIPRWPDVDDEYPVTVLPLPARR